MSSPFNSATCHSYGSAVARLRHPVIARRARATTTASPLFVKPFAEKLFFVRVTMTKLFNHEPVKSFRVAAHDESGFLYLLDRRELDTKGSFLYVVDELVIADRLANLAARFPVAMTERVTESRVRSPGHLELYVRRVVLDEVSPVVRFETEVDEPPEPNRHLICYALSYFEARNVAFHKNRAGDLASAVEADSVMDHVRSCGFTKRGELFRKRGASEIVGSLVRLLAILLGAQFCSSGTRS